MEKRMKIILGVIILVIAALAIYFTFFYKINCKDEQCWNNALMRCYKAGYIDNQKDVIMEYTISDKSKTECSIEVKLLTVKEGNLEPGKVEGKSMTCNVPLGVYGVRPSQDLSKCHGLLKEALQEEMIRRMHSYIIENLGSIEEKFRQII